MKQHSYIIVTAILAVMLVGCNGNKKSGETGNDMFSYEPSPYFADSLRIYNYDAAERCDTVKGDIILQEVIGAYSLNVVDSLICLSNGSMEPLFSIYNLSGDSIAGVGVRGQGPSDFTSNSMNRQNVIDSGDICIWIIDVNSAALKRLNLTKSIESRQSRVDSIIPIWPMVTKAFIAGDTVYQEVMTEEGFDLTLTDMEGRIVYQEPIYKHKAPASPFMFYYGKMGMSPDNRHLVLAMSAINQLNIIDLKNGFRRKAVSLGGVKGPESVIDSNSHTPIWTYYSNPSLSDRYIYALYQNQPYSGNEVNKNSEVHVFDYDGNLIKILPLDRHVGSISYSALDNSIYAMDEDEHLLKYDLSAAGL